jgi:hypothetical protein
MPDGRMIIYQSNTLTNPRAMMVKSFHTVVAYGTVRTSWGPIKHAGITVLGLHSYPIDDNILCAWQTERWGLARSKWSVPFITFRLWRMSITRYYTRISS